MSEVKSKSRVVLVKPVERVGPGSILQGARKGLACPKDEYGNLVTGHTREEIAAYKKLQVNEDFFETLLIMLGDKPLKLDLENEKHLCWYRVLKIHPEVAGSKSQISIHTNWYIEDEEEEARQENLKFEEQMEAYSNIKKMSPVEKRAFLTLFGKKTKNVSDEVVLKKLKQLADENPELFNKKYTDKDKATKILINQLIEYRIFEIDAQGSIYHGENLIGIDERAAVATLSNPKNNQLRLQFIEALEEKMKI